MEGKIIRGIGGFYYVHVPSAGVFECRARGLFRKQKLKPLIGDNVRLSDVDIDQMTGYVDEIMTRKNELIRPTVANVDQAVVVFAVSQPEPNLNLLDRFLVMVEREGIRPIVCFNKIDTLTKEAVNQLVAAYELAGYQVMATSKFEEETIDLLKQSLYNQTTVFAGPSGVGKSSILNIIQSEIDLETGSISDKNQRGKHTTRHAELISFHEDSYVVDTPGFSSLNLVGLEAEEVKDYFIEFTAYEPSCRYGGCNHLNEPSCGVKDAVQRGEIADTRYESYRQLFGECQDTKKKWT